MPDLGEWLSPSSVGSIEARRDLECLDTEVLDHQRHHHGDGERLEVVLDEDDRAVTVLVLEPSRGSSCRRATPRGVGARRVPRLDRDSLPARSGSRGRSTSHSASRSDDLPGRRRSPRWRGAGGRRARRSPALPPMSVGESDQGRSSLIASSSRRHRRSSARSGTQLLRNLDVADLLHPRLALLLLLEQLALARDVASVALRRDVLSQAPRWSRGR